MARNEKRRQKSLQRHAAKRKEHQQTLAPSKPSALPRSAGDWPLHECLVSRNWDVEGEFVQILVARRGPRGEIAAAVFLVDLGCLGVKDAFARVIGSLADYLNGLRLEILEGSLLAEADLNLAARIIREGIGYARQLGFKPHRDYHAAAMLLHGADPDAIAARVPLGKDGKPFFVAGPSDNVSQIMAQLTRAVGPEHFDFLVPLAPPPEWSER